VWIDYFNGKPSPETDTLNDALGTVPVAVGDIMLVEVLQGFRVEKHFRTARELMLSLEQVNMLSTSLALRSAGNYRKLRQKGATVRKTTDCIIATWCIENQLPLLHCDRDFQTFHDHLGLEIYEPPP
ncbi:MAG: PIN domain nuclease, partial [Gammaproteobacteria bacterium]|nr:PIN domain nuclease [Gammaproteobacteria bacterium]